MIEITNMGGLIAIINKGEYYKDVNSMINEEPIYEKLKKNPTNQFQNNTNKLIDELTEDKIITETQAKSLKSHNSIVLKLYCLRKTYKPGKVISQ
ncbi:hypothetical protein Zmor_011237 [Zophobas morio]|uniref:Uncharacterized protein n=1 Tax=Zophobas morio TaxID=2755281 RepID=A0AA38IQ55_9CUCU|nr:hypothetical protein Zmor_011237 [Zophobas morio]